jgi:hypothetical protein
MGNEIENMILNKIQDFMIKKKKRADAGTRTRIGRSTTQHANH